MTKLFLFFIFVFSSQTFANKKCYKLVKFLNPFTFFRQTTPPTHEESNTHTKIQRELQAMLHLTPLRYFLRQDIDHDTTHIEEFSKLTKKKIQLLEKLIELTSSRISVEFVINQLHTFQNESIFSPIIVDFNPLNEILQLATSNKDLTSEDEFQIIEFYHTFRRNLLTFLIEEAKTRVKSKNVTNNWYIDFQRNVEKAHIYFFILEGMHIRDLRMRT